MKEVKTLDGLAQVIDLSVSAEPENPEEAYRRGYCDGWIQAIEQMHDLMFDYHVSRQEAYEFLWDWWRGGPLRAWGEMQPESGYLPPLVDGLVVRKFRREEK